MRDAMRLVVALVVLGWVPGASAWSEDSTTPERTENAASPQQIVEWIAELDSDRFTTRQEATKRLVEAGEPAIERLLVTANQGSLEASVRAVKILEKIFATAEYDASFAAEQALETLVESQNRSAASRADTALLANSDIRRKRALTQIVKLGGKIKDNNDHDLPVEQLRGDQVARNEWRLQIGPSWMGGDEGLEHIKRLNELPVLYLIDGAKVSEEAIEELQLDMPDLVVARRGRVQLGISMLAGANAPGCFVRAVTPGGSAQQGGIQPGDLITKFGGDEVDGPDTLVELIAKNKPGDRVQVEVTRDIRTVKLEIELQAWKE